MNKHFSAPNFTLGILGGGQLGRMLLQKTVDFNISTAVMDGDAEAPCKNLCTLFVNESFTDEESVYKFGKTIDLLTVEIEHVNTNALKRLEAEGLPIYPQPAILEMVKDKGLQKLFYQQHHFPTSDFVLVQNKDEFIQLNQPFPIIQKIRTGGYDGKGVMKISSISDFEKSFDAPMVIEDCIDIEKEISVIVARNKRGHTTAFPAVEMCFNVEANLVELLFSPASISVQIANTAEQIALDLITQLKMVGVLAVELFITKKGEVLINEIAPRPHNSGHHTIEANITSQYEQHVRAILDLPLGSTEMIRPSAMVNLLGEKGFEGNAVYDGLEEVLFMEETHLHLYGKKTTKPFRKMGHVTVTAASIEDATLKAEKIKKLIRIRS